MLKRIFYIWGPVLLIILVAIGLSSISIHIAEGWDKVLHVLEYSILGFFLTRAMLIIKPYSGLFALSMSLILGLAVALFDEFYQAFIPLRQSGFMDAFADVAGILLGMIVYYLVYYYLMGSKKLYQSQETPQGCCSLGTQIK